MPDVIEQLRSYGEAVEAAGARRPRSASSDGTGARSCWPPPPSSWSPVRPRAGVGAASDGGEDAESPVVDTAEDAAASSRAGRRSTRVRWSPGRARPWCGPARSWSSGAARAPHVRRTGHADGAAYDPATGRWRPMSAVAAARRSRRRRVDGRRGARLVGRPDVRDWPRAAAWDPATDTWRSLAPGRPPALDPELYRRPRGHRARVDRRRRWSTSSHRRRLRPGHGRVAGPPRPSGRRIRCSRRPGRARRS